MTVKKGGKLFRCWIADIIMTFYIFCSLYQRVVLISTMPYSRREVSTLMQGTQVLILLRLNPPGYLLIWISWLKGNSQAGDNGRIFCRTSWFIQIIRPCAGSEANCTWTMCLSLPRSAAEEVCLLQPKMDTMGCWEKFEYVAGAHRRNVWGSIRGACKSMQLWQKQPKLL